MVDAANITQYKLSTKELEAHAIFWVLAAGKNGTRAAKITREIIDFWSGLPLSGYTYNDHQANSVMMNETNSINK